MRTKFGNLLMVLGTILVLGALFLFLYNWQEQLRAQEASMALLPQLIEKITQRQEDAPAEEPDEPEDPVETTEQPDLDPPQSLPIPPEPTEVDKEMTVVEIDGYGYIGFLSFPSLELELPVMADWDYSRLKIAPCRYTGTVTGNDLVLMAHNYTRHFGRLNELKAGDLVTFTDMDGNTVQYEVVALDILAPTAVEEMTSGDYDLTLFTCTYGGRSRVTVYCDRRQTADTQ